MSISRSSILILGLGFSLACAGPAAVSTAPPSKSLTTTQPDRDSSSTAASEAQTRFHSARTPHIWPRKRVACNDAVKQVRKEARRQCDTTDVHATRDSCECTQGKRPERKWGCKAQASYICSENH